ncbi:hypothetical protein L207DRAFT_227397 [Hyaloscypha variabilis F]|uniref:Uncharacterized protein n=1 Tax=Hyaloscypha variabilis (strain UAMH 11265 / GT02V1 / F) TaxID=1149755 RepID=A0A2J6QW15_HYAVF|nr:hypothetical protein L207DRAFT_227397 [Hyaloscypha variabilis F]
MLPESWSEPSQANPAALLRLLFARLLTAHPSVRSHSHSHNSPHPRSPTHGEAVPAPAARNPAVLHTWPAMACRWPPASTALGSAFFYGPWGIASIIPSRPVPATQNRTDQTLPMPF